MHFNPHIMSLLHETVSLCFCNSKVQIVSCDNLANLHNSSQGTLHSKVQTMQSRREHVSQSGAVCETVCLWLPEKEVKCFIISIKLDSCLLTGGANHHQKNRNSKNLYSSCWKSDPEDVQIHTPPRYRMSKCTYKQRRLKLLSHTSDNVLCA